MNAARFIVHEDGHVALLRGMDVVNPLIEANSPEENDFKWRAQNELKLKEIIDWKFINSESFDMPKVLNIHTLNLHFRGPGLGWEEAIPMMDTRFETLLDFLLFYEYVVVYPLVFPQKRFRQRWVGK